MRGYLFRGSRAFNAINQDTPMIPDADSTRKQENPIQFVHTPGFILRNPNLTIGQKLIFGLIVGLSNETGYCWASNSTMAAGIGISERTVASCIDKLKKERLIRVTLYTTKSNNTGRKIFVYSDSSQEKQDIEAGGGYEKSAQGVMQKLHRGYEKSALEYNTNINSNHSIKSPAQESDLSPLSKPRVKLTEDNIQELLLNHYHSREDDLRDDIDSADAHCQQKGIYLQGEAAIGFLRKWKKNGMEFRGGRPKAADRKDSGGSSKRMTKAERIKAKDDANFAEIKKQFGII